MYLQGDSETYSPSDKVPELPAAPSRLLWGADSGGPYLGVWSLSLEGSSGRATRPAWVQKLVASGDAKIL
ncbi:hypothetical protein DENSPDRAFT_840900 [Dentipellis sp. KUC8613]|nr:hypothetical protein DENSPDRAFT_840900 [Dentipellis sp. KUC8613]